MERLIFCRTPLQAMIVASIQLVQPADDTLLYQPTSVSSKHHVYFDRLIARSKVFIPYIPDRQSHYVKELRSYFAIPANIRNRCFENYLVSSFDSLVFAMLVGRCDGIVDMYDDGLMNLLPSEIGLRMRGEALAHRYTKAMLGAPHVAQIVKKTRHHFTIYPPEQLVIGGDRSVPVQLFSKPKLPCNNGRRLRILLGTPIDSHEGKATDQIMKDYESYCQSDCDIFIAHPSEKRHSFISNNVSDQSKWSRFMESYIAEELVMNLLNEGFVIDLFGISSSVLLNMAKHANSTNVVIPNLNDIDLGIYKSAGIQTVSLSNFLQQNVSRSYSNRE